MKIAETQTEVDFPSHAILTRNADDVLTKVVDRTGTQVLWERNSVGEGTGKPADGEEQKEAGEAEESGGVVESGPAYPKIACDVCGQVCGNAGALTSHIRAKHPIAAQQGVPAVPLPTPDLSVEGRTLPRPVIQALENLLSNATFQSIRKVGDKPMEDFFYGFASGMQAALAIVCGSLGYNTDFLNEEITDAAT